MPAIKVIKKDKIKKKKAVKPVPEKLDRETANRAMVSTVAGWVNELRKERGAENSTAEHFVSNGRRLA